jgi:nicotinamide-nucleotide amidase
MNALESKAREVVQFYLEAGLTIATAESCTGGMIASALVDVPGVSAVFDRGFVTYSNEAKIELLDVSVALIEKYGAVSQEVAIAMADGALAYSRADVAVAVTGVAGPDGGTAEKPVGFVCFAIANKGNPPIGDVCNFSGNRREVRLAAAEHALAMLAAQAIVTVRLPG